MSVKLLINEESLALGPFRPHGSKVYILLPNFIVAALTYKTLIFSKYKCLWLYVEAEQQNSIFLLWQSCVMKCTREERTVKFKQMPQKTNRWGTEQSLVIQITFCLQSSVCSGSIPAHMSQRSFVNEMLQNKRAKSSKPKT